MDNSNGATHSCRTADEDITALVVGLRLGLINFGRELEAVENWPPRPEGHAGAYETELYEYAVEALQQYAAVVQYNARKLREAVQSDGVSVLRVLRITNKLRGAFRESSGLIYETAKFIRTFPELEWTCRDILSQMVDELITLIMDTFDIKEKCYWDGIIRENRQEDTVDLGGITLTGFANTQYDPQTQYMPGVPNRSGSAGGRGAALERAHSW